MRWTGRADGLKQRRTIVPRRLRVNWRLCAIAIGRQERSIAPRRVRNIQRTQHELAEQLILEHAKDWLAAVKTHHRLETRLTLAWIRCARAEALVKVEGQRAIGGGEGHEGRVDVSEPLVATETSAGGMSVACSRWISEAFATRPPWPLWRTAGDTSQQAVRCAGQ